KALGSPEVSATRSLVCEVAGNAVAKRMGLITPEPCIVDIFAAAAEAINASLASTDYTFTIKPGPAAGCALLNMSPYTVGQALSPELQTQAVRLYVFDLLTQNMDRRSDKVNCGLSKLGLVAFDFETCFQHLFLPIVGGLEGRHWEPSKSVPMKSHLFYGVAKEAPPLEADVRNAASKLAGTWWTQFVGSLPAEWQPEA